VDEIVSFHGNRQVADRHLLLGFLMIKLKPSQFAQVDEERGQSSLRLDCNELARHNFE